MSPHNEFEKTFSISMKDSSNKKMKILLLELLANGLDVKYSTAKSICFTSKVILTVSQAEKILNNINNKFQHYEKIKNMHKKIMESFSQFARHFGIRYDCHKITDKSGHLTAYRYQLKVPTQLLNEVKIQLTQIFNVSQLEISNEKDFNILSFEIKNIQDKNALNQLMKIVNKEEMMIFSHKTSSHTSKKFPKGNQLKSDNKILTEIKSKLPPKLIDFGKHGQFNNEKSSDIKPLQSQFFSQKKSGNIYVKFAVEKDEFANKNEFKSFEEIFTRSGGAKLVPHKGNKSGVKGIVRNYDWVRNKAGEWIKPPFKVKDSTKNGRVYAGEIIEKGEDTLYVFDTYISNTH